MINSQTGIREPIDGILGLSRDRPFLLGDGSHIPGPLYVKALKTNDFTTENTFSIFMKPYG